MAKSLKIAGLFSGIGGLELGLIRAGHQSDFLCEIDEGARAVLQRRFPHAEIYSDVRALKELPADTDVLTAGFPCQDLSPVGRTLGINGSRSSLVKNVFRLLRRRPVPWVIIENVPFMLKLHHGAAIKSITSRLERIGYKWAYRVLDSRAFGVPQRRKRVFIVGSLQSDPRFALLSQNRREHERVFPLSETAHGFYWTEGNRGVGWAENAVPALKGGSGLFISSPPAILLPDGKLVVPNIEACERLQGFPAGWTKPASWVGMGKRRGVYVGNAVTVGVAKWLGERLVGDGTYIDEADCDFDPQKPWPLAAWYDGHERGVADISPWPKKLTKWDLESFIGTRHQPLSRRAAAGFLSRLQKSQLRTLPEFQAALAKHIAELGDFTLANKNHGERRRDFAETSSRTF